MTVKPISGGEYSETSTESKAKSHVLTMLQMTLIRVTIIIRPSRPPDRWPPGWIHRTWPRKQPEAEANLAHGIRHRTGAQITQCPLNTTFELASTKMKSTVTVAEVSEAQRAIRCTSRSTSSPTSSAPCTSTVVQTKPSQCMHADRLVPTPTHQLRHSTPQQHKHTRHKHKHKPRQSGSGRWRCLSHQAT